MDAKLEELLRSSKLAYSGLSELLENWELMNDESRRNVIYFLSEIVLESGITRAEVE